MIKKYILTGLFSIFGLGVAFSQSLNINCSGYTVSYPSDATGVVTFYDGETVTIQDDSYKISDITGIYVADYILDENTVLVNYNSNTAEVIVPPSLVEFVSATITGADVELVQSKEVSDKTCGEITYRLAGNSSNGSFSMDGSFKATIELDNLSLTSLSGAALNIDNGKRISLKVLENTVNTLADAANGKQKGVIECKGHLEFKQKGTVKITGYASHAIYAKEYIEIKNSKINILGAVKDGINCAQYFLMESGELNISDTGEDGIQVAFKDNPQTDEEDTGELTIEGGSLNITVTAEAVKALKTEGDFIMKGGTLTASTSGNGIWDSSKLKTKASACIGADGDVKISGGTLLLTSTGSGGKGITAEGKGIIEDGDFTIVTHGGMLAYVNGQLNHNYTGNTDRLDSDYKSAPKGIKIDGDIEIAGGKFDILTDGYGAEGIESKSALTISGGELKVRAYDDGTNSSKDTSISGGNLDIMSIGNGDGIDSNGNIYISGGQMCVYGAAQPEQGFDAGDGCQIFFTGGNIFALAGGGNSVPSGSSSTSTQAYLSANLQPSAGSTVTVSDDSGEIASFTVAEDYKPSNQHGFGGGWHPAPPRFAPPFGGGMSMGGTLVISLPELVKNKSYKVTVNGSTTNVTAQ